MRLRLFAILTAFLLLLTACGASETEELSSVPQPTESTVPVEPTEPMQPVKPEASAVEPEEQTAEEYQISDPAVLEEGSGYVAYNGVVEHLFFHPVIAYPEMAFDGDAQTKGLDDWMVTVKEFVAILESVYARGYVLVDIADVWSESVNAQGQAVMVQNTLYLPEGKKPLILSYDDPNYYSYMLENGFTYKLILGEDGKVWSWGLDPEGNEVVSRDLDAITILDKFVEEHPDFSPFGAKACLSVTGFEGVMGYRTNTTSTGWTQEKEAYRQQEIEAVKPIIAELKRTGWTFGCHTWGHIRLGSGNMTKITTDMEKWFAEVGSLVGETNVLFYPHGERPDGGDWKQTGETFRYLNEQGFQILCSVGIQSFSYCKPDICAVICDRLHPDGTTFRSKNVDKYYGQFYDVREVMDLEARPDYGVGWE